MKSIFVKNFGYFSIIKVKICENFGSKFKMCLIFGFSVFRRSKFGFLNDYYYYHYEFRNRNE